MKKFLLLLFILSISGCSFKNNQKVKVILAVFAHPDDEGAIAQVLAKYAKQSKVYLVIVTDGRYGTKNGFPAGDSLVKIRQAETQCACKILGLQQPIFLGFTDGFDTRNGVGTYFKQSKLLKEKLTGIIQELNPDVIITFGPEGDTGHADHRLVSDITTEIIFKEGWVERFPLYYIGWTNSEAEKFKEVGLNTVDKKYLNVSIKYSEEDELKAMKSLGCYKSQMSDKEVNEWVNTEKKDTVNTLYFRQISISSKQKTGF